MKLSLQTQSRHDKSAAEQAMTPQWSLNIDVYRLRRLYERNSPVILIQSLFRSYKSRNKSFSLLTAWKSSALFIQRVYRGWTLRKQLKDKLHEMLRETGNAHLIMSYREDLEKSSMIRIKNALRRWIRRKQQQKLEHKSAIIIQSFFRGRRTRNTAFLRAI